MACIKRESHIESLCRAKPDGHPGGYEGGGEPHAAALGSTDSRRQRHDSRGSKGEQLPSGRRCDTAAGRVCSSRQHSRAKGGNRVQQQLPGALEIPGDEVQQGFIHLQAQSPYQAQPWRLVCAEPWACCAAAAAVTPRSCPPAVPSAPSSLAGQACPKLETGLASCQHSLTGSALSCAWPGLGSRRVTFSRFLRSQSPPSSQSRAAFSRSCLTACQSPCAMSSLQARMRCWKAHHEL